ncbi:predicted protein [Nematostella vectensis]|uniref:Metallo-beta-lactamase domain-containing protein n=1 Tax=Nematostella vectensis TaxID=45351 RepID=A7RLT0_NEMVE|nr:acyl-coenzyme A thioesterase MBLAC2 [Nematostella vectensis]EDO47655.1 predicted protein [Nematostella vectensis]|eukprot:XP_001639718.1 predicted protein [Nematostella vectensis]
MDANANTVEMEAGIRRPLVVGGTERLTPRELLRSFEPAFTLTQVENGLYLCQEKFFESNVRANIWVLQGSALDIIIDPGIGLWDLPGFLSASGVIGEKPFQAVATHAHFDHCGGLFQFDRFSLHQLDADTVTNGDNYAAGVNFILGTRISNVPIPNFNPRNYELTPTQPSCILTDGNIIDLGDKKLEVLHIPGHTPGSIALFEQTSGLLFTGDMLVKYKSRYLDLLPFSDVTSYAQSCHKLLAISQDVTRVCPGHFEMYDGRGLESRGLEYLETNTKWYRFKAGCIRGIFSMILRGRNTRHCPTKSCYYGCCCFLCFK